MAVVRKKLDDKNLKILREIVSINGNKQCFDCNQRGPTYVNMTIGSFVCTRCSGILRGLTPPHRVKSISMATFTSDEIEFIRSHGNDECGKTWMGLWDPKRTTTQDHRELLVDKYEKKRYYLEPASPLKSINTSQQLTTTSSTSNSTDNLAALKAITLTPPSSLRLYKNNSSHHQQHHLQQQQQQQQQQNQKINLSATNNFQQQFTPDDSSSLFQTNKQHIRLNTSNNNNNNINNNNTSNMNNNNHMNGVNRYGLNITSKNGVVDHNNKFTPESDFVADFGTANIFTATSINNNVNNNNQNHENNNLNNHSKTVMNGTASIPTTTSTSETTGNNENFADFDHNPIYNAAGLPISLSSSNSLNSSGTFNSSSSLNSTPSADRYAALKDLDEQIREHKEKEKTETSVFNTVSNPPVTVNPFKTNNPFQHQQQSTIQPIPGNWAKHDQVFGGTPPNGGFATVAPSQIPINNYHNVASNVIGTTNGFATQLPNTGNTIGQFNSAFTQQQNGILTNGFQAQNPFQTGSNNPFL